MANRDKRNIARVDYRKMQEGSYMSEGEGSTGAKETNLGSISDSAVRTPVANKMSKTGFANELQNGRPKKEEDVNPDQNDEYDDGAAGGMPAARPKSFRQRQERDDNSEDEELLQLKEELRRTKEEKRRLESDREKERIRREIESTRREITDLKGKKPKPELLTIKDLREMDNLKRTVKTELKQLALVDEDSLSDSNTETREIKVQKSTKKPSCERGFTESSDTESDDNVNRQRRPDHSKKQSGIKQKSSDRVKRPQIWPHSKLQYEFVNKALEFDELDLKLFIAGELEIISAEQISKRERKGRLCLLKKIMYYTNMYEWKGLKSLYASWLRQIELGIRDWSDDSSLIEGAILPKYVIKDRKRDRAGSFNPQQSQSQEAGIEKAWFCPAFQRNRCEHKGSHTVVIKGRMKWAQHICATCWQKDGNKQTHPECSTACPHHL